MQNTSKICTFFKLRHNNMTVAVYAGYPTTLYLLAGLARIYFGPLTLKNCEQSLSTRIPDVFGIAARIRRHSSLVNDLSRDQEVFFRETF